ncbi:GAF domain-containing sensor histidine kinase [Priestia koreensis]|uniref:histidine kinase n=1 Tax=Priestia koreensis TaxID=284581 RepID=A0A0M0L7U5_9BACI|nr:GAF domain-containing sensor histidine kinase [Priestia koreensis]KOO47099.1 histidine kinase [Priestia koreensis]
MTNDELKVHELRTLKAIAETLNSANDIHTMLNDVLKEVLSLTKLEAGWIYLIDEKGNYSLAADYKLPEALCIESKKPMCEGGCWCLDRYNDGRLKRAANIIECKRLEDAVEFEWGDTRDITHHATVPLLAGDERFGLLNVASPHKNRFVEKELALLEGIAYQIGTALKRIALTQKEQESALLAERNRLAKDLHDSVNQLLFSISLTAGGTKEMTEDVQVKEMLDYIQGLSKEALSEMRSLIWQLRPQGLEEGVGTALANYGKVLGLTVQVDVKGVLQLSFSTEEALWRIGQEALNNCSKHSETEEIAIVITGNPSYVSLEIHDDGKGFQYNEDQPRLTFGLTSMKERAESLNGTFQVTSAANQGTTIYIQIPLKREGM